MRKPITIRFATSRRSGFILYHFQERMLRELGVPEELYRGAPRVSTAAEVAAIFARSLANMRLVSR